MNGRNMSNSTMSTYQEFIHLSRYSRYMWDAGRRETWDETVDRWVSFFKGHAAKISPKSRNEVDSALEEIRTAILGLGVMPSMRTMMTAGSALERDNIAAYNCSFLAIDRVQAFDELLYILMNGTGVGFSVERQFINKLPVVAEEFHKSDIVVHVQDSKLGWAKALKEIISLLYQGQIPSWDVSKVRESGAPLMTFGGRASGPGPLVDLFRFAVDLFRKAAGRKLSSIECHDLVCKIADSVVVGGVRRSALISLSNLSDDRLRSAKQGQWWEGYPHRRLANNSAAYTEKPEVGTFMDEWKSLYDSKSGERGIFNRQAAKNKCESIGRDPNFDFGTNPCVAGFTVVTVEIDGVITDMPIDQLGKHMDRDVKILSRNLKTGLDEFKPVKAWAQTRASSRVIKITDDSGNSVVVTPEHLVYTANRGYVAAIELTGEDEVIRETEERRMVKIEIVEQELPVYDVTVEDNENFYADGFLVHNCGEIILRDREFCNLSEVIVRAEDDMETLKEKVRLATIIGTLQSTLTDFKYISKKWRENCEEERLLGVSLTGIMDSVLTNGKKAGLDKRLDELRAVARETNAKWADLLGIPHSKAITCVKPSGTVSQLVNSGSGIHARHSRWYIRRARLDNKDPMAAFMREAGFPLEADVMAPDHTLVASFPIESPKNAVFRDDMTAIEQLELWAIYREHWCDHNPSITVTVREHEWMGVGAWVYDNFDEMTGVSFLPHSDHTYRQQPYEEIDEPTYKALVSKMPVDVDWSGVAKYEGGSDNTTGTQELNCAAGGCEIL